MYYSRGMKSPIHCVSRRLFALLLGLFLVLPVLAAEEFSSSRGFFIDLPEGYSLADADGSSHFVFSGPDGIAKLELKLFEPARYTSFTVFAETIKNQLDRSMAMQSFDLYGRPARLGQFANGTGTSAIKGQLLMYHQSGDTPYFFLLLSYTQTRNFDEDIDFLISALDGLSVDQASRGRPGPYSVAALARLGQLQVQPVRLNFGKTVVATSWRPQVAALAQELVEREFRVLMPYGEAPDLVEAAMRRFYRMIYRQTARELDQLALQLSAAWESGGWAGQNWQAIPALPSALDAGSPQTQPVAQAAGSGRYGIPAKSLEYVSALLEWTQGFVYERDFRGSDVVNPITAAFQQRGDCDSRALVLAILLKQENIDAGLMISLPHSHALAMFDVPGSGARFPYEGRRWLVGETTAKVQPGMIDQRQSDIADWFGIDFDY